MSMWSIYFCYGGIKHLFFQIEAELVDLSNLKDFVTVGETDKDCKLIPDDRLLSQILTFNCSHDRKGLVYGDAIIKGCPNMKIKAKIWCEKVK